MEDVKVEGQGRLCIAAPSRAAISEPCCRGAGSDCNHHTLLVSCPLLSHFHPLPFCFIAEPRQMCLPSRELQQESKAKT